MNKGKLYRAKALVTGAGGFIGSHLSELRLTRTHKHDLYHF